MISGDIDSITKLTVRRLDTDEVLILRGREAWCCATLIQVGERGFTRFERPAHRVSHYVWLLRTKRALPISTEEEAHGGPYRGSHARYHLRVPLKVIEQEYADVGRAA